MRASPLALAALLIAAGCGSDDSSTNSGTAAPAPTAVATTTAAEPDATAAGASNGSDRTFLTFETADGTAINYVLVVPPGREVGVPGKVLFAFPPGGQDLDTTQRVVDGKWRDEALARGWVVVSPAAPKTGLYYNAESAALVPELLDMITTQYPPEDGKFDLAGVSNGGLSAFTAALTHPERFRSLVVFPGYSQDGGDDPNLSKLKDIGVSMFVGGDDSGWLGPSQQTEETLKGLGYTVELHVVPGEGHIIGSLTGADLFDAIERVRA
jgi:enterochelin esterase-like enzyme